MSAAEVHNADRYATAGQVDMHLEVQIIPVSDVDLDRCYCSETQRSTSADRPGLTGITWHAEGQGFESP